MGYLYLNFCDNLNQGSKNYDDYYTLSLSEQYQSLKNKLGRTAPETLEEFVARCCPLMEMLYFISIPAFDRKIKSRIKKDGTEGVQYINNVVIRPSPYENSGIPSQYNVILIGDIVFGSVIAFSVKGIELIDSEVAKFGERRVVCTAVCAFVNKSFSDRMGRLITVPDYGTRETKIPVLTHDVIDQLCTEVYPIPHPENALRTIERWKQYLSFRRYYLGVQSEKCEKVTDVSVKSAYVVNRAAYRKNEESWSEWLLDGHREFAEGEQIVLERNVAGSDEFPLICIAIEKNKKEIFSETAGRGKPKYESYLRRYTKDSMGLSEAEPHYDEKGNLPKNFKFPYTLGERFRFTYTDIEPDCHDLEREYGKKADLAVKEIESRYRSIIEDKVKRFLAAQEATLSAEYDEKYNAYAAELAANLARESAENKDKEVQKEYEEQVVKPIERAYSDNRKQLEQQLKEAKKSKDKLKISAVQDKIAAIDEEESLAIASEKMRHPVLTFYEKRNTRLLENKRKSYNIELERALDKTEKAKRSELQAAYKSSIKIDCDNRRTEYEEQLKKACAERIEIETVRRYEIYFCPENTYDTDKEIRKDLEKIQCAFLTYDNRAEKAKLERQEKALFSLVNGYVKNPYLASYLFEPKELSQAVRPVKEDLDWCLESLNDTQRLAVRRALASESIFLLQGPPGTGKTQVIAEITAQLAKKGKKVLISSETHKAIDNVFERLPKTPEIRPLRLIPSQSGKETNYSPERLVDNFYLNIQGSLQNQIDRYEHYNETKENFSEQMELLWSDYRKLLDLRQENAKIEAERKKLLATISQSNEELENLREELNAVSDEIDRFARTRKLIGAYRFDAEGTKLQYIHAFREKVSALLAAFSCFADLDTEKAREIMNADLSTIRDEVASISGDDRLVIAEGEIDKLRQQINQIFEKDDFDLSEKDTDDAIKLKELQGKLKAKREEKENIEKSGAADISNGPTKALVSSAVLADSKRIVELPDQITLFRIKMRDVISELNHEMDEAQRTYDDQETALREKINGCTLKINDFKRRYEELSDNPGIEEQEAIDGALKQKINRFFRDFGIVREYDSGDMEAAFSIIRDEWDKLKLDYHRTQKENMLRIPIFKEICRYLSSPDILEEDRLAYTRELYQNVNVFGITCTSRDKYTKSQLTELAKYGIEDVDIRKQGIDVVIIDEVSKSSFLDLLIPILYGKTVILVGDHRQLPPMYDLRHMRESDFEGLDEKYISKALNEKYTALYEECFFKTLYEQVPDDFRVMLNKQYRCHSHIMEVFNHFYGGNKRGLMVGKKQQDDEKQHGLTVRIGGNPIIDPDHHIYFVDCTEKESSEDGSTSKQNKQEASVVMELLKGLDAAALDLLSKNKIQVDKDRRIDERPSVGVICTYGDQAGLIKKRRKGQQYRGFSQKDDEKLIISTVDDFQGDERDIILVSMVRNPRDHRFNAEFVKQFERINVAFSRARKLLIIVGARKFLSEQTIDLPDLSGNPQLDQHNYPVYQKIIDTIGFKGRILRAEDIIGENDHG